MSADARVLIITGYGVNCERETEAAFARAGASHIEKIHFTDILENNTILSRFSIIAFIGGFSFGDHISAGKVFSAKIKYTVRVAFEQFVANGGLIIGICNGFQTLVKLGLLPAEKGITFEQTATLTENECGYYYDGWVHLKVNPSSPCIFTKNMDTMFVPVRHGEGRIFFKDDATLHAVRTQQQIVVQYCDTHGNLTMEWPKNPNGSQLSIAGICDPTGRIFGLMPHPEAYVNSYTHPNWSRQQHDEALPNHGDGFMIFKNAVDYARNRT